MYFYNIYTIINVSFLTNTITNIIHDNLRIASRIVLVSKELQRIIVDVPEHIKKLLYFPMIEQTVDNMLINKTIISPCSVFINKGKILSSFWKIKKYLPCVSSNLRFIGHIDCYISISEYLLYVEECNLPWTYSRFKKGKKRMSTFWNPCILNNKKKPIPNSLKIKNKTNSIIVTGPNAAGKSTYIKTIFVNAILAQTLGVVFAKKWISPGTYKYIDTYFNVPDIEGKASTFQAEMRRCYDFIKTLENIKKESYSLVSLDEIFTSTNYKEGVAGSYSIIKYISDNYPNTLSLITTHYHCLSKLEEISKNRIMNFCFKVNKGLIYSYKVRKGISEDHVALDLLEKEGFPDDILNIANKVYSTIKIPKVRFLTS